MTGNNGKQGKSMCKITGEQDIQCKIVPTKLIEAPIFHTGTQILKISHQNGG